jgi:hypothetical protein
MAKAKHIFSTGVIYDRQNIFIVQAAGVAFDLGDISILIETACSEKHASAETDRAKYQASRSALSSAALPS